MVWPHIPKISVAADYLTAHPNYAPEFFRKFFWIVEFCFWIVSADSSSDRCVAISAQCCHRRKDRLTLLAEEKP
jgi:hypothetical protein